MGAEHRKDVIVVPHTADSRWLLAVAPMRSIIVLCNCTVKPVVDLNGAATFGS